MELKCQRCGDRMEAGYVLDSIATQTKPETWVEGEKPKSVWESLTNDTNKKTYEVEVFRCGGCGYLESYAKVEK